MHLRSPRVMILTAAVALTGLTLVARQPAPPAVDEVRASYTKFEYTIPMRDGTRLFTAVYAPKSCVSGGYPIMLQRTPYSVSPYGVDNYRPSVGPSEAFQKDGYIFAYQDVRGRYMSEGIWVEVRPHIPAKQGKTTDESSDTYDTIDWLVKHLPCNNTRVGMWGISYPGFYVSAGMIDAHPSLKAASPQAPVTDYYLGDDAFHNGAFMLAHNFGFYVRFSPRGPEPQRPRNDTPFDFGTPDGYQFYLGIGPLRAATKTYGLEDNPYWTINLDHTTYDDFWKARAIWRHFKQIAPEVLTVGGWYDAEDLMGPLRTYRTIRSDSPATKNRLVMGPWTHGGWARGDGTEVGNLRFGQKTGVHYREQIEYPFFARILKDVKGAELAEAHMFETGTNRWRTFDTWPPKAVAARTFYLEAGGVLTTVRPNTAADAARSARSPSAPSEYDDGRARSPSAPSGYDEYLSDPNRPVPLVGHVAMGMPRDYMTEDQRFAATRPDVLVYRSEPLAEDLTVLGPIAVSLHVATSGTDSDFVVKVIDEYPADFPQPAVPAGQSAPANYVRMAGYQQLVRGEPFRGKFRRSFEKPEPFTPNEPATIAFELGDVAHTFRRGHRLIVQVQSSWFPLVDRNPQKFLDIPDATPADFVKATQRIYRSAARPSSITVMVED